MDQNKSTELFKKMGKIRPNEMEETKTIQSKPAWLVDESRNPRILLYELIKVY